MALIDFAAATNFFPGYKSHWGVEDYVFSAQTKDFDMDREADGIDGSAWGNRFMNELPAQQKASYKVKGLHSGALGQIGNVLQPMVGATAVKRLWVATEGLNALSPVTFGPVSLKKYSTSAKFKDAVEYDAEWSARGDVDDGFILVTPKTNNVLTTTGNGSDLDNGATLGATSFGGNAQLHVFDLSGGTTPSVTVILQDSADGSTWAAVAGGGFTAVTSATLGTTKVQRLTIGSTTTIRQHVRAQWTTTGTPTSVQALVTFARNIDPDA